MKYKVTIEELKEETGSNYPTKVSVYEQVIIGDAGTVLDIIKATNGILEVNK